MRELIVNADDFALTDGCNDGIINCFKEGIVTSTTIIVTGDNWEKSVLIAKKENLKIGLHLCLTYGRALTNIYTMTDDKGFFKKQDKFQFPIDKKAVKAEWQAQVDRLLGAKIYPDHLDSHHHVHTFNQDFLDVAIDLAKELNVPLRQTSEKIKTIYQQQKVKTTDFFVQDFYGQTATKDNLIKILQTKWQGTMEIMCHPAFVDEKLLKRSSYSTYRQKEMEILTHKEVKDCIEKEQIQLISFTNI